MKKYDKAKEDYIIVNVLVIWIYLSFVMIKSEELCNYKLGCKNQKSK